MKRLFPTLLLLIVAAVGYAQADANADTPPEGPVINFESTTIDYGEIDQNSNGVREFKFTNTGTEPLLITNAKGSCGCTVPTYPKEAILPGDTGVIKVKYATNRLGAFTKYVTLTTNASDPTVRLKITGKVNAKAEPAGTPEKSGMFGGSGDF